MLNVWIGLVEVPESVEFKIRTRRGITGAQVRAACEWPAKPVQASWNDDPDHGRRLIVYAWNDQDRLLKVVLQPVDAQDGTWRLRTAIFSRRAGA